MPLWPVMSLPRCQMYLSVLQVVLQLQNSVLSMCMMDSKTLYNMQVLALAMAFQNSTRHHLQQPPVNNVEPSILQKCMPQSRCTLPQSILAKLPLQGNASSPSPSPSAPSVKAASSG